MLQGRSESWGPQAFLDGAAIANTHTGPNEIGFVHLAHTFVVHLGALANWEVAINSDRKITGRTIPGSIDIAPASSDVFARWTKTKNSLRVDISAARLQRLAGMEFDNEAFQLQPPDCGFVDKKALTFALLMQQELRSGDAYSPEIMDALVTICATHLLRNYSTYRSVRNTYKFGGLAPFTWKRVQDYIHSNLREKLTIDSLAEVASLSQSHFLRAFRETTGQSPHQYILQLRLDDAKCQILATDMTLSEIAVLTGFSSHSHLSATMQRLWQMTPRSLR